jgi:hypothetical protein
MRSLNAFDRPVLEALDAWPSLRTMPDTTMPNSMLIGEANKRLNSFWIFYLLIALTSIRLSGYGN